MYSKQYHSYIFVFFNDRAPTEISPLPQHDALPILASNSITEGLVAARRCAGLLAAELPAPADVVAPAEGSEARSEEHTSELQSRQYLVCRLLLEKKKTQRVHEAGTTAPVHASHISS